MNPAASVHEVLSRFGPAFASYPRLDLAAAGGMSGARFWRIGAPQGPLCLRRWPAEHPSAERLGWIHAVLEHVHRAGLTYVPVPLRTASGDSFVEAGGHLWELAPWMPGVADYRRSPNRTRLEAAMQALARFHVAAATFPGAAARSGPSPAIGERRRRLVDLLGGDLGELLASVGRSGVSELSERAKRFEALFSAEAARVLRLLDEVAAIVTALHPCIRDIHDEHVLFTGDVVTGLIDFGAMRIETPAADVSRLLGSMAQSDANARRVGIEAYRSTVPFSEDELKLATALDQSTLLLAPANWFEWLGRQGREFEDMGAIVARIDRFLKRLAGTSGASPLA